MTKLEGLAWRLGRYAGLPGFESQYGNPSLVLHVSSKYPSAFIRRDAGALSFGGRMFGMLESLAKAAVGVVTVPVAAVYIPKAESELSARLRMGIKRRLWHDSRVHGLRLFWGHYLRRTQKRWIKVLTVHAMRA